MILHKNYNDNENNSPSLFFAVLQIETASDGKEAEKQKWHIK